LHADYRRHFPDQCIQLSNILRLITAHAMLNFAGEIAYYIIGVLIDGKKNRIELIFVNFLDYFFILPKVTDLKNRKDQKW
jgi:hypothetical protein